MLKNNIRSRVLIPLTLTFVLLTAVFVYTSYRMRMEEYEDRVQHRYKRVQSALASLVDNHAAMMSTAIAFISGQERFTQAMLAHDREALLKHGTAVLETILEGQQITHFYFYDTSGNMVLRVYQPENKSAGHNRYTKQQAMNSGKPFSGLELGTGGTFTLRTVHPWLVNGRLIGYMELGQEIDHILHELKMITEVDFIILISKQRLERAAWETGMQRLGRQADWNLLSDKVIIDQTIPLPAPVAVRFATAGAVSEQLGAIVETNGKFYRSLSFPLRDAAGQVVGDFVMLRDLTEQTRAFRAFMAQVAAFSLVLCGGLFGFAYRVLGKVDMQLEENRKRLNEEFAKQAQTNRQLENEIAERTAAEERLVELNEHLEQRVQHRTSELNSLNQALENAYKDLQAQQATIVQQDKMACIGQLAASVAHDINNPIGFVAGNLEVLQNYWKKMARFVAAQQEMLRSCASERQRAEIEQCRHALKVDYILDEFNDVVTESLEGTERVKKIVLNLKGFSRLDEPEARQADIHDCLESTLGIVRNELRYKADIRKEYGVIPEIFCYPQQLNQVFMNLLLNASQAIEQWGEITITTWADTANLFVAIKDTGCGIPPESLERLFEPFFTTKGAGVGTGLGLSIVHDIIKRHHGEIAVVSEPCRGTVFTVKLPLHGLEPEAHHG